MKTLVMLLFSGTLGHWKRQFTEAQNKQCNENFKKNMTDTSLSFCMELQKPEHGNETHSQDYVRESSTLLPQVTGGFWDLLEGCAQCPGYSYSLMYDLLIWMSTM